MGQQKLTVQSGLHRGDYRKLTYWNMFGKDRRVLWMMIALLIVGTACIVFGMDNLTLLILGIILAVCPLLVIIIIEYNIFKVLRKGNIERRTNAYYIVDQTGISACSEAVHSAMVYHWADLTAVYENMLFYIFFINKIQMLTIRKTDLDLKTRQTLLNLVRQYVPETKLHLQ